MGKISIYNVQDTPIGRGSIGQVYPGTDPQGNKVAIKEILDRHVTEYLSDPHRSRHFHGCIHDGIHMLNQHPFIAKTYASFEERDRLYLVMEYIEGETVEQYVKRRGAIPESEAIHLILDILSALNYAHSKGYLHRDIKPGNIMIRPDGSPCLLDFCIARYIADISRGISDSDISWITPGAVNYMSPEQASGLNTDNRSDIYSLGCVLFYMLAGQHPIQKQSDDYATRVSIIYNICNSDFPKVRDFNPNLSQHIQQILDRATARDMTKRFRSCAEFETELSGVIHKQDETGWWKEVYQKLKQYINNIIKK
ncbi:MAG: serine/threonine protein kinase [Prevotellaceae bacterium]|jgi:serine/threonine-protein kinase|nr:serine/threonine protein kinase [Prevotellaceae bacterium]